MATYACPQGHSSTEPDYCSDCGAKIANGATASPLAAATSAAQPCPDCGTPHELVSGKFCEICGYNFSTGGHGELPGAVEPVHGPGDVEPTEVAALLDQGATVKQDAMIINPSSSLERVNPNPISWEVVITIDPTLRHPDSPEPPTDQAPVTLELEKPNTLVGRSSPMRAIYPDIALDWDDAVSHRHALINCQPDGKLTLRDIGSSNGTSINNIEIAAMVDILLNPGDAITLGHWTKLKIIQKS